MNFAIPALVVFVLLAPGFACRAGYSRAEATDLSPQPFGGTVYVAVIVAVLLHVAWGAIATALGHAPDIQVLLTLLEGEKSAQLDNAMTRVAIDRWWVLAYFVTLFLSAPMIGAVVRGLVSWAELDKRPRAGDVAVKGPAGLDTAKLFRFKTPWYYLFGGYDEEDEPAAVVLATVVELGGDAYLFVGLLGDYFLTDHGSLDRVVLRGASRRKLGKDRLGVASADDDGNGEQEQSDESRFYPIEGDYLVLHYSQMKTLNVRYLTLKESNH